MTLWEGGLPYKLDGLSLSTDGKSQLGAVLKADDSFGAGCRYYCKDDTMSFYSCQQGERKSRLSVYEFGRDFKLKNGSNGPFGEAGFGGGVRVFELEGFKTVADIAVTDSYHVVCAPNVSVDGINYLLNKDPAKCLKVNENEPGCFYLLPRGQGGKRSEDPVVKVAVAADGIEGHLGDFSFSNSWEEDEGRTVVIEGVRSLGTEVKGGPRSEDLLPRDMEDYRSRASKKELWRFVIDATTGTLKSSKPLSKTHLGFPVIDRRSSGSPSTVVYGLVGSAGSAVSPWQGVVRIDESGVEDTWIEKGEYAGEPYFVPRVGGGEGGEKDGYLVTVVRNEESSYLAILDASDLAKGPVCKVLLAEGDNAVPHGLHGCWAEGESWGYEEIRRRAKLADKLEAKGNLFNEVKSDFSGLGLRLDDFDFYGF